MAPPAFINEVYQDPSTHCCITCGFSKHQGPRWKDVTKTYTQRSLVTFTMQPITEQDGLLLIQSRTPRARLLLTFWLNYKATTHLPHPTPVHTHGCKPTVLTTHMHPARALSVPMLYKQSWSEDVWDWRWFWSWCFQIWGYLHRLFQVSQEA